MACCRALIPLAQGVPPAELLPPLLQGLGLEVEPAIGPTLMAFERPCSGRRTRDYVRLWANWSDIALTGELWLEALSGESMARSHTRCSELLDQIRSRLGA
jgi:hypothetical protein